MENSAVRTRYQRQHASGKRRRNVKSNNLFYDKLAIQVVISVLILILGGIIKNSDTKVTDFIGDKFKVVLTQSIELKSLYERFESMINTSLKKVESDNGLDELAGGEDVQPVDDDTVQTEDSDTGADSLPTDSSDAEAENLSSESGIVQDKSEEKNALGTNSDSIFILPVSGILGSGFGERIDPILKVKKEHKGIDIEAAQGTSIKSSAEGEISETGFEKTLGNYIRIQHTGGFTTLYAHCAKLLGKKGQQVKQGDIVAQVGSTGQSTGPHLHFEIWKDEEAQNPLDYVTLPQK